MLPARGAGRRVDPAGGGLLADPHHLLAGDVDDQEAHVLRAETVPQVVRDHVQGRHRRRILGCGQKLGQHDLIIGHRRLPAFSFAPPPDHAHHPHATAHRAGWGI